MTLKYHLGSVRLKNGWGDWKGGYLDCNPANHTVYTGNYNQYSDPEIEGTTSWWTILPAGELKGKGEPVLTNDVIYLGSIGYLDTAGRGCNDNLLCVSLSGAPGGSGLPADTGRWRIRINDSDEAVEIGDGVGFHLQSCRDNWSGGYLATRGYAQGYNFAGNIPLLLAVSTQANWDDVNGDPLSGMWRVEPYR